MDFLAFDIEAANGYKPYSICSVGIVIADENFRIKHRENIWINPKTKYNLNGTRQNVGIDLHLDKELLDRSPTFPEVYDRLCSQLTDENYIVVGHAVESDVHMLNAACKHYKLPCINFKFICSQLLFRLFKGEKEVRGLNKIADELCITFEPHNSEEDAFVSLMTLKYLVQNSGLSVEELLDKYMVRKGENHDFELTRTVSLLGQASPKRERAASDKRIFSYLAKIGNTPKSRSLEGGVFSVARSIEMGDFEVMKMILDVIYQNGGIYTSKPSKSKYYIKNFTFSAQSEMDKVREQSIKSLVEEGKVKMISINDLLYMARM
jgi:DNA polymerase III epsilon subunit-like protein